MSTIRSKVRIAQNGFELETVYHDGMIDQSVSNFMFDMYNNPGSWVDLDHGEITGLPYNSSLIGLSKSRTFFCDGLGLYEYVNNTARKIADGFWVPGSLNHITNGEGKMITF